MSSNNAARFVRSYPLDARLAPFDVEGSIAHATMLGKRKIIPPSAAKKIVLGLKGILKDYQKGKSFPADEDIHFVIEKELIRRIGEVGGMLHTARSRNDQVATDLHLYLKDQIGTIRAGIRNLQRSLLHVAGKKKSAVMPGYTHLQHAQPVLFAHHLLAYAWMLERDKGRFQDAAKRVDVLPLGSAALAGTSFPIDRHYVARLLKFGGVSENSMDATASRDTALEFLAACSILMTHLSKLAEELILWSSDEFGFVKLSTTFTTGSSIMPQKRNPDQAELVRGKSGRVIGSLVSLLTTIKGTPLSYNRDLQEDKPPLFEATDAVVGSLGVLAPMIKTMKVIPAAMKKACESGYLSATELADFLASKGVPFRAAHGLVRTIVASARQKGKRLDQFSASEFKKFHPLFDSNLLKILKTERVIERKTSYGGTSLKSVNRQMSLLKKRLLSDK